MPGVPKTCIHLQVSYREIPVLFTWSLEETRTTEWLRLNELLRGYNTEIHAHLIYKRENSLNYWEFRNVTFGVSLQYISPITLDGRKEGKINLYFILTYGQ
jgi:hypothetical protein